MSDEAFEGPLDDDAIVVRFGANTLELDHLRVHAAICNEAQGFYGLSFYGDNGLAPDEIARLAGKPNREMRLSAIGRLRGAGFVLERRGRFPHLTLRFDSEPSDKDLRRVEAMFDQPVTNPHPAQ